MLFMGVLSRLNPVWIHETNVFFIKICIGMAFGRDIVWRSFLWRRGCADVRAKRNICWQFDLERLRQFRWRQLTLNDDQRLPRSPTSLEDRASALTRVWFLWPQPWYTSVHKCMCDKAVQADGANSGAVYTLHKCKGDKGVQTDEVVTVTHDVQ